MKKILTILAVLVIASTTVSAQFIRFGVKTGLNFSKLKFDDISNIQSGGINYKLSEDENFTGFHIGLMSKIKVFDAYIQPEIYFNTSGGKVLLEEMSGGVDAEHVKKIKYNKIDLPVLIGGNIKFLRLNAGPVASVILSSDSELGEVIPELKTLSKDASIGFQAGAGFDLFKTVSLDFRYEAGLSKVGEKLVIGSQNFPLDSRASKFMFSVGFFF